MDISNLLPGRVSARAVDYPAAALDLTNRLSTGLGIGLLGDYTDSVRGDQLTVPPSSPATSCCVCGPDPGFAALARARIAVDSPAGEAPGATP